MITPKQSQILQVFYVSSHLYVVEQNNLDYVDVSQMCNLRVFCTCNLFRMIFCALEMLGMRCTFYDTISKIPIPLASDEKQKLL